MNDARKKILVIDDDADFLKTIQVRLEDNDYRVLTCLDGENGLSMAKNEKPDLIILDLILPGITGENLCKNIRSDEEIKHIPIIMLTCKDTEVDRVIGMVIGADAYITKPLEPKKLLDTIEKLLK